jgi:predicted PurR-regulated permease PerM
MEVSACKRNTGVYLLFAGIFCLLVIAFWPVMSVFVWAVAFALVLMPLQRRFRRILSPSLSATLITSMVVIGLLVFVLLATGILYMNLDHIGLMVSAVVQGFDKTGIQYLLPPFTQEQLANMPATLVGMFLHVIISLTSNIVLGALQVVILFLTLSMLLYKGDEVWETFTCGLTPVTRRVIDPVTAIGGNTVYSLIFVQVSAAAIAFLIAVPFFYLFGHGNVILYATLTGIATLIPMVGAQLFILFFVLYLVATGDFTGAAVLLFAGYPLLSGWIDFYYRPVMMGKRTAVHPVLMMIGFFVGIPFMGLVGFILGPVLVAVGATAYRIYREEIISCSCEFLDEPDRKPGA